MSEMRRDYSVLISFATKEEADVAASALRADGVDAFVGNEHHAAVEWWAVLAFGGVQVMVPSVDLQLARGRLSERVAAGSEIDSGKAVSRRDRWKFVVLIWWMVVPNLFIGVFSFSHVVTASIVGRGVAPSRSAPPRAIVLGEPVEGRFNDEMLRGPSDIPEGFRFPEPDLIHLPRHYGD